MPTGDYLGFIFCRRFASSDFCLSIKVGQPLSKALPAASRDALEPSVDHTLPQAVERAGGFVGRL